MLRLIKFNAGLIAVLAFPAIAQIRELATTDDGSVLLFSSTLRLARTVDGPQSKLFRWDGKFSVEFSPGASPANTGIFAINAFAPVMSGDGKVIGYAQSGGCPCFGFGGGTSSTFVANGVTINAAGSPLLSHNGRYAVIEMGLAGPTKYRLDLTTGECVQISQGDVPSGLTDAGQVLYTTPAGLRLGASQDVGNIVVPGSNISGGAISADGSRILYTARHDGVIDLHMGSAVLASIQERANESGQPSAGFRIRLSNDGSRALIQEFSSFIDNVSTAWWIELNSRERHELGPLRDGSATLSGDGRTAWLFQPDGYLARIQLDTGERTLIGEPLPSITGKHGAEVRGSLNRIQGSGFGQHADWRLTLANPFSTTPQSRDIPVLDSLDSYVDFQIPWTVLSEDFWVGLGKPGGTFENVIAIPQLPSEVPVFWTDPDAPMGNLRQMIKAVHQDFSHMVTPGDPARPGEVVHIYMTGLGPVVPAQFDFTGAPANPPAYTADPLTCSFNTVNGGGIRSDARVLFAGLAAGMVGIYQVELEVPPSWTDPVVLACNIGNRGTSGYLPVAK